MVLGNHDCMGKVCGNYEVWFHDSSYNKDGLWQFGEKGEKGQRNHSFERSLGVNDWNAKFYGFDSNACQVKKKKTFERFVK